MAKEILGTPKVEASGFMDLILMGLSKTTTEQILTPMVGNGTFMSGGLKFIAGAFLQKRGKIGKIVGSGLVLDSIDDITHDGLKMLKVGRDPEGDEWA